MAYTTIDDPTKYFVTVIYTGNGSARSITTGLESTDFIWNKRIDNTGNHLLYDSIRGANKDLNTDSTEAEETQTGTVTAFGSDSFSLGTHGGTNANGEEKVNWCWAAGTAFSNSAGANGASFASTGTKNDTAGFSIVSYTGDESGNDTIFHGLSQAPEWIITKARDVADNWGVFHGSFSSQEYIFLNTTSAKASASSMFNALPGSTVFTVGDNAAVNDNGAMIAYCWHSVKGYSQFGTYTGNGNADGPFIFTGFKPAFVMQKNVSETQGWQLQDNKRDGYNGDNDLVQPHSNANESGVNRINILSNGFKVITTDNGQNKNSNVYIYMAFAESPFVNSNGVPTNGR